MVGTKRGLVAGLFVAILCVSVYLYLYPIQDTEGKTEPAVADPLSQVIKNRIDYYNQTYSDILFVHLDGGDNWQAELANTILMLGNGADALDYEHSQQLREQLLSVTLKRLKELLLKNIVGATLFRVGQDSTTEKTYLCTIALNTQVYAVDDYQATIYMLDLPEQVMKKVDPARYLNNIHHLEFTIDHEAFHCIDSYLNGGVPITSELFGGEYNMYRRENIADAYAMLKHLKKYGDQSHYARNLIHLRAMWFSTVTPGCCTFETIRAVMDYDYQTLVKSSEGELIALAKYIRNRTTGDYDNYLIQRKASMIAGEKLGRTYSLPRERSNALKEIANSPALVEHLLNRYEYYYRMLFNDEPIELGSPHAHDWKSSEN